MPPGGPLYCMHVLIILRKLEVVDTLCPWTHLPVNARNFNSGSQCSRHGKAQDVISDAQVVFHINMKGVR